MTVRKALVHIGGDVSELPAGDLLDGDVEVIRTRHSHVEPIESDRRGTSFVLSDLGTMHLSFSSGSIWKVHDDFTIANFDSSASSTFTYVYRNGVGGHTLVPSSTLIDNLLWDDGSGTLANIPGGNARFVNHWVFARTTGDIYVVYGQEVYRAGALDDALIESPPDDIPSFLLEDSVLLFQITIQENQPAFIDLKRVDRRGPAGPKGEKGDTGLGTGVFKGQYNPGTIYNQSDMVQYQGSLVYSNVALNQGNTPDPDGDTPQWLLMVQHGAPGPQGPATLTPLMVSQTATTSTSSTVYVLLDGMIHLAPQSGNYIAVFIAAGREAANNNNDQEYGIFVDGVLIPESKMDMNYDNNAGSRDIRKTMASIAEFSLSGTENVEIRYRTSGGVFEVFSRNFLLLRV